jgi:DNA-binding transcriptional LysR family regulator
MELRHLRYFSAVAESLNMSKASSLVNVTQPALSRQIKDLEEELGVVLLNRHSSGVTLTEGGRLFLRRSKKILSFTDEAIREATSLAAPNAFQLRVGFDEASVSPPLFQALHDFGTANPTLSLSLVEASPRSQMEQLRSGGLDLALIAPGVLELSDDIEEFSLPRRRLHVLINALHGLATAVQVDLASLEKDPLIVYDDRYIRGSKSRALNACRRAGFEPPLVIECNSYAAMAGMVAAGRGYGLCPDDTNLSIFKAAIKSIPLLQSWDSPGTSAIWLRSVSSAPRDGFVQCFAGKHRSR